MTVDLTPARLGRIDHLRYKRLWLGIGCALVAIIVIGSIARVPGPVASVMVHDKLLHLCAYAGLMGWFAQIFRHDLARVILALAFMVLGVGIEFLQGLTPNREFEVLDMVANSSGVLLAWASAYTGLGNFLPWLEQRLPAARVDM